MIKIVALLTLTTLCVSLALAGEDTSVKSTVGDSTHIFLPAAKLPKMIDLGSKSCIPCKKMAPILDELREKYRGRAEIIFIDTKENRKAAAEHKITLIPTQIFFDTLGTEAYRHVGFFSADSIEAHLSALGVKP